MTKTITFKQSEKKVYEIMKEIKNSPWSRSGNLRTLLRVGTVNNITEAQAKELCKYADKGQEQYNNLFESLDQNVKIELEKEQSKEITLSEAMERVNDKGETVRAVHCGDETTISKYESVSDMMDELGIRDFDDLSEVKFFTVVR
ncbi:hypothetical protein HQK17_28035 [Bacillus cereus]|uniref:hypothetical protein n=1 Tax=Bacillus cereus TaxID=1396 RepID=UPI00156ABFAD|nr:hypothetical protein [Bacillus cereus]NRQ71972.1 hypothetical protein [Bacillus cereus]